MSWQLDVLLDHIGRDIRYWREQATMHGRRGEHAEERIVRRVIAALERNLSRGEEIKFKSNPVPTDAELRLASRPRVQVVQ